MFIGFTDATNNQINVMEVQGPVVRNCMMFLYIQLFQKEENMPENVQTNLEKFHICDLSLIEFTSPIRHSGLGMQHKTGNMQHALAVYFEKAV